MKKIIVMMVVLLSANAFAQDEIGKCDSEEVRRELTNYAISTLSKEYDEEGAKEVLSKNKLNFILSSSTDRGGGRRYCVIYAMYGTQRVAQLEYRTAVDNGNLSVNVNGMRGSFKPGK